MTTITTYTDAAGSGYREVEVEVRFTKRAYGGWLVRRADNGRELGWLVRDGKLWQARVSASAFRGQDVDDYGDVLDDVPLYLFNGKSRLEAWPIVSDAATREDAAHDLLWHLHRHHATALGYGPHPAVTPYRSSQE